MACMIYENKSLYFILKIDEIYLPPITETVSYKTILNIFVYTLWASLIIYSGSSHLVAVTLNSFVTMTAIKHMMAQLGGGSGNFFTNKQRFGFR